MTNVSPPSNTDIENKFTYTLTPIVTQMSEQHWPAQRILWTGQWYICNCIVKLWHRFSSKIYVLPYLVDFHPAVTFVPDTEWNLSVNLQNITLIRLMSYFHRKPRRQWSMMCRSPTVQTLPSACSHKLFLCTLRTHETNVAPFSDVTWMYLQCCYY